MSTSASSRSAAQPAGAGRSASERAGIGARLARAWRAANSVNAAKLTRSIIGTIGDVDTHQLPDAKGFGSMQRYLAGETDEMRQRWRDEILGANVADFRAFADALAELTAYGQVVALGSERAIRAADARRPGSCTSRKSFRTSLPGRGSPRPVGFVGPQNAKNSRRQTSAPSRCHWFRIGRATGA